MGVRVEGRDASPSGRKSQSEGITAEAKSARRPGGQEAGDLAGHVVNEMELRGVSR